MNALSSIRNCRAKRQASTLQWCQKPSTDQQVLRAYTKLKLLEQTMHRAHGGLKRTHRPSTLPMLPSPPPDYVPPEHDFIDALTFSIHDQPVNLTWLCIPALFIFLPLNSAAKKKIQFERGASRRLLAVSLRIRVHCSAPPNFKIWTGSPGRK